MKKLIVLLMVLVLGGCELVGDEQRIQLENSEESGVRDQGEVGMMVEQEQVVVELVVDDDDQVATYSAELSEGETVLGLLQKVASDNGLEVEVEHYDFGDMVESIGDKVNSKEKAWIYFVNGEAGEVGAGEKELSGGELVEWKYIEPIY